MRLLIAGCGYVGTETAKLCRDAGFEVFGLRRSDTSLPDGITLVRADLVSGEGLDHVPSGITHVVYAVGAEAHDESAYRRAYVAGLTNLLSVLDSSEIARFLFVSSTGVYGERDGAWIDESSPVSAEHFSGRSLLEGERIARAWSASSHAIRFGGIYGPGRDRLIREVASGRAAINEGIAAYTNRIHRDDCARALLHILRYERPAPVYNAVDDEPCERNALFRWLGDRLGAQLEHIPNAGAVIPEGKRCRNALLKATGFELRYPTFREGYGALLA